ncbi:MAG TPA: ABC transporter ATP-binding protein [Tepidisphaeraceae bacterium]|nr:ABC transporter ATP-binding protein [Tepidisphaeraceae bacterium]
MTSVHLQNITKHFGDTVALNDISLRVGAGELFFLLGPSGCGKSTLLRLIAGLLSPDEGRIVFNEREVTALSTERRNAVMCFQSYALWPHMTVKDNVAFGLSVRGQSKASQRSRVEEVLKLVQMSAFGARKPNQLSGGQQQRVALARALAVQPACLLLDEPLSNLDTKLRQEMRGEIRRICKSSGVTTVYVTHDQKEALSVADKIAVLNDGKLMQVGSPHELYLKPKNSFVAEFMGATNLLPGTLLASGPHQIQVETAAGIIFAPTGDGVVSTKVTLSIRPENVRVLRTSRNDAAAGKNRLPGKVVETTFLGDSNEHLVKVYGSWLRAVSAPPVWDIADDVMVEFDAHDVTVLTE